MKKILGILSLAIMSLTPIYGHDQFIDDQQFIDEQEYLNVQQDEIEKGAVTVFVSTSSQLTTALQTASQNTSQATKIYIVGTLDGNFIVPQSYHDIYLIGSGTGATLSASSNGTTLIVSYGANVTVKNLTIMGGNTATTLGLANSGYGIYNLGRLNIVSSTISGNKPGGIYNGGPLTVQNSVIESNNTSTTSGTGIYSYLGNVNIYNSTITDQSQYGIEMYSGYLNIYGSQFNNTGTNAISDPTAIYLSYSAAGTISNTTIDTVVGSGNSGYGIYTDYSGQTSLVNSTISNVAGYGIYNDYGAGVTSISGSNLINNTEYGIYNYYSAGVQIINSTLSGSTVSAAVGLEYCGNSVIDNCVIEGSSYGISCNSAPLSITGSNIQNNTNVGLYSGDYSVINIQNSSITGNQGGGINSSYSVISIHRSHIRNNSSTTTAGGVHSSGGSVVKISNSDIEGNSSTASGGGIYNNYQMTLNNVTITGNSSSGSASTAGYGGGIYNDNYIADTVDLSTLIVNNCNIYNNTATKDGGGLYNLGVATIKSSKVNNNTALHGGGIANSTINPSSTTVTGVSLTLFKTMVNYNTATTSAPSGGGVYNHGSPTFNQISSPVTNNTPDQIAT